MEDLKQKQSKPFGIILSFFLISGIMVFLWSVLHLLFPLGSAEIYGLIALAIVMVVYRIIYQRT